MESLKIKNGIIIADTLAAEYNCKTKIGMKTFDIISVYSFND